MPCGVSGHRGALGTVGQCETCVRSRCVGVTSTMRALSCSVVVPVRDDEVELRGLLEALKRQSMQPLEVIVVDNGSRDGSAEVARAAGCTVVTEPFTGIPAAAAAGYDLARGEVIVRCDADSRPPPRWIAAHESAHRRGGSGAVVVTGPSRFALPAPWGALFSAIYLGGYMLAVGAALGHLPAFGTTMSMRTQWWHRVRGRVSRSDDVHDDMDLSFQVGPREYVRFVWSVGVVMSPRALQPSRGWPLRWARAVRTLDRNWQVQTPWDRWAARLTAHLYPERLLSRASRRGR